jgi:hypothetical protein
MLPLAERVLEAYGGAERWRRARRVTAMANAGGLAFRIKRRPVFAPVALDCAVHRPFCRLTPIGRDAGLTGVLEGGETRLEDAAGRVTARRPQARGYFPGGRRLWRWDDLDMAYFAGYAFWEYLTFPASLMNPAIDWSAPTPTRLRAEFPADLPVHSRVQTFDVDPETGLLTRNDYVAEVIGGWAKAANRVLAHRVCDGLQVPAERLVTPQGPFGRALPGPALIRLSLWDVVLHDD